MGFLKLFGITDKSEKRKQWMIENGNEFLEQVERAKSLPVVNTSLFLNAGEKGILQETGSLNVLRAVRQSTGGGGGMRVAKGVYVGGYSGQAESHKEWRTVDTGTITLTSGRIVFVGSKENRDIDLKKILAVNCSPHEIHLSIGGKDNEVSFTVSNPFVWNAAIGIIRNTSDPFALKENEVSVQLG